MGGYVKEENSRDSHVNELLIAAVFKDHAHLENEFRYREAGNVRSKCIKIR